MVSNKRVFVTLWPSDSVRERLRFLQRSLDPARRVDASQFHITLAFLGEVQAALIDKMCEQLAQLEGTAIREVIDKWGTFNGPGVVWVGPSKPSQNVRVIRKNIVTVCQEFTVLDLEKTFTPHITLLRRATATMLHDATQLAPIQPVDWESNEFCLAESNHGQYQTIARFSLDNP